MYICVERLVASDGTIYELKDRISSAAYAYLQPSEREHFEELKVKVDINRKPRNRVYI